MNDTTPRFRRPPPGFTRAQWDEFQDRGILTVENAYGDAEIAAWQAAIERLRVADSGTGNGFFTLRNYVEKDPAFVSVIDHPGHLGFVYDLYGEMLKLQLSELFVRAAGDARPERWHIDGPRTLPYAVFAPEAPLQVRVGIWLNDVRELDSGNLVHLPGSHRRQYFDAYNTDETVPGEEQLIVRRGSMTLMNCALWHRTAPNNGGPPRRTLYVGYCPSWIPTGDRTISDPAWLATLNREQRIIMRSYGDAYHHAKPPPEDFPLFLDRKTGADREPGHYRDHIFLAHRKRTTAWEEFEAGLAQMPD